MKKGGSAMRSGDFFNRSKSLIQSFTNRSSRKPTEPNVSPMIFVGAWTLRAANSKRGHSLLIGPDLTVAIDNHPIPGSVEKLTARQMVFLDRYGYHLIIKCNDKQPIELYDEADEMSYEIDIYKK